MFRHVPTATLLALLFTACGSSHVGPASAAASRPETHDLMKALALALPEFDRALRGDEPFQLIAAEQMTLGGRYVWHLTWKPIHLMPEDPATGMWGAGGEVFVNVDLGSSTATHAYGE